MVDKTFLSLVATKTQVKYHIIFKQSKQQTEMEKITKEARFLLLQGHHQTNKQTIMINTTQTNRKQTNTNTNTKL